MLLRESLGNVNCRTTMIAHISAAAGSYAETLSTIQIASRVLRMKKKKTKVRSSWEVHWRKALWEPDREPPAPGAGVCGAAHAVWRPLRAGEPSGQRCPIPLTVAGHPARTPTRECSAHF